MKDLEHFLQFSWENVYKELTSISPSLLSAVTAIVCDIPLSTQSKPFSHIMLTAAIGLHGRNHEMSVVQYLIGFILTPGGCTQRDIERLSKIGICTHPQTIQAKLNSWQKKLDQEIVDIKNKWADGGNTKFQLVGDNWDKNILPSYRTSDRRTLSLHLFNIIYAIIDRVVPQPKLNVFDTPNLNSLTFIPSVQEQEMLMKELTIIFGTSITKTLPQISRYFQDIYPVHLNHIYSEFAGIKTAQYPLGLYDCNENKTQEMIQRLTKLSNLYVPCRNGEIVEPVFFGGDRLTDERVQGAQNAMSNAGSAIERLEGFIINPNSKTVAIHKLSYSTESGADPGTMYYYRNLLNMRNVKGNVKNAYRPSKQLYYTVLDGLCLLLFLDHFEIKDLDSEIPLPENFQQMSNEDKITWLNTVCSEILKKCWVFFENTNDVCASMRDVLDNPEHAENYWVSSIDGDRLKCHFCPKSYVHVGSLKSHEMKVHNVKINEAKKSVSNKADKLQDYLIMVFKLILLHKNLDSAVDMGDGERSVRSAKYELPIYNKTNKTKYTIGSIHLTALTSGILPPEQKERLIANRFVNVQGGRNNNIALDEYLEMLNRDSKTACTGHQTKESIINHSKQYALLINLTQHFDEISDCRKRKGFHHPPSYTSDVHSIVKDLLQLDVFRKSSNLKFKGFKVDRNPFDNCVTGLSNMIQRHTPKEPFHRLHDPHI